MSTQELLYNLSWVQPELILAATALLGVLLGAALGDRAAGLLSWLAAGAFVVAGVLALQFRPEAPQHLFHNTMVVDAFSGVVKALIAFSAAVTLLLGADYFRRGKDNRFEFALITTIAVLGFFVMASASNLITLYVGVELQSLASYVLAAFRRDDARSSEAGLKYFLLGALSSGLLLYGCSFVYGFTGALDFAGIAAAASAGNVGLLFGFVFILCGLAFKMSAAPFHMWTPDVYEGAPTPVTALFAAAPKLAAIALTARVLYDPFIHLAAGAQQVTAAIAAISIVVGSFAALVQTNIKRLMAYSSIANMGYVMMALAAGREQGAAAALIFMAIYLPATIGAFALILAMRRDGGEVEQIVDLAGLAASRPWMAAAWTMLLFSLAGLPPLAGIWGKYYAFRAILDSGLLWLAIVAALGTVVAAGYYLWIAKIIWFDAPARPLERPSGAIAVTATAATLLIFPVLTVLIGMIQNWAVAAAHASF